MPFEICETKGSVFSRYCGAGSDMVVYYCLAVLNAASQLWNGIDGCQDIVKRVQEKGCSVSLGLLEAFCEVDFCGQSEERVQKISEKFIMLFAFPGRDVDYFFCIHNYVAVKLDGQR